MSDLRSAAARPPMTQNGLTYCCAGPYGIVCGRAGKCEASLVLALLAGGGRCCKECWHIHFEIASCAECQIQFASQRQCTIAAKPAQRFPAAQTHAYSSDKTSNT